MLHSHSLFVAFLCFLLLHLTHVFLVSQNFPAAKAGAPQRMTTDSSNRIGDPENCSAVT